MCGILVYKTKGNNFYIQKRGQDLTSKLTKNGFTFVHNLLSVTGSFTPQPYVDSDIVCLYNGEIYNHKFINSDGENLIPLYKKYGVTFPKYLDGEWAIILFDFKNKLAVFATDLFATKPIWRNGLEAASYESGIVVPPGGEASRKIPANTIEVVHFDGKVEKINILSWDLNQYKNTYDDWIKAFEKSVKKRASKNCFIGLSSGYDSGAIACELVKQAASFKSFIIEGRENKDILAKRIRLIKDFEYISNAEDFSEEKVWVETQIEPFDYIRGAASPSIQKDRASIALSKICRLAHAEGRKVYLSGQGADEIMSDYALFPKERSTFRGKFPDQIPENLWENFYGFSQYNYISKEEYVAGSHSVETRYPYLDKDVVQEFLWLTPELKNKYYKAPIHEYLKRNHFPFAEGKKVGLRVNI